jgi:hypothetical protein
VSARRTEITAHSHPLDGFSVAGQVERYTRTDIAAHPTVAVRRNRWTYPDRPGADTVSCLECHHEYHAVDAATPKEDSVPDIVYDPDALAGLDHGALPWAAPVHLCLLVLFLVRLVAVIRWARDADGGRDDNGGGGGWGPGGPETPPPPSPPSGLLLRQVIPAPRPLARTRLGSSRADVHPPAVRLVAKTGFVPPTGVLWTTDIDGGQALAELEGRACHGHEQLIGAATHGDVSASPTVCHEG